MEPLEDGDPRQVGRFEIVARLGAGGMGRVYLARLPSGEQFALKMIHQFLSDDVQFRRRFHREVMAAQRVTGENTAALVDADPDARPPWMAVEYVEGPTLSELIERGGPLTVGSSLRLASGMAQALISIHAAGLVHRDLKPSNVLMGAGGARLIDFGIAQASGASSLTMTGLVTGSAGFMSPEQAQAERVTEASDVFALGTVLYFAATGHRPFGEGSMISVTYRVVHAEPDLSGIRDDGLRQLIADCLMKDPRNRPTPREIYERCPHIADGSWIAGATGETRPVIAVSGLPDTATVPHPAPPAPLRSGPRPPVAIPTRRDGGSNGQPAGMRRYVSNPWLAIPVAGILALAAGTAIALTLAAARGPDQLPGKGTSTVTRPPIGAAGETPSSDLPVGAGDTTPSIYEVPTRPSKPKPTATGRPVTAPTATKPGNGGDPGASSTDPGPDDPAPTKTTQPPVDPPATTTPAPTVTTPSSSATAPAAD